MTKGEFGEQDPGVDRRIGRANQGHWFNPHRPYTTGPAIAAVNVRVETEPMPMTERTPRAWSLAQGLLAPLAVAPSFTDQDDPTAYSPGVRATNWTEEVRDPRLFNLRRI